MKKYLEILKKSPLFMGISEDELIKMLGCLGARVKAYEKKHTILSEGSPANDVGIVLSGSVQSIQVDYYGNRNIFSENRQTEIFAEEFACAEVAEMPVTVTAGEPCEVMMIDCGHILHTCHNNCGHHQRLIYNLMRELANKNLSFHKKIEITAKRTTREKLLAYLMHQAKSVGNNSFDIPFDRQELADYLEVDRSGLSAEIGKLKREGIIKNRKNHFVIMLHGL